MKKMHFIFFLLISFNVVAQVDNTVEKQMKEPGTKVDAPAEKTAVKIFYSQKLINANTVEIEPKGSLEFKVIHNFGDIAGSRGGIHNFYGLDNAADVKIAFQAGLSKNLNIIAARTRGDQIQNVTELWELGLKYNFLKQLENDRANPLAITAYVNTVVSAAKPNPNPDKESAYMTFSDRMSNMVQVMVARKFGKISLQLNPTFVHTNLVVPGGDKNLFAIGGAIRLPVTKVIVLIADYFHPFLSQESRDSARSIASRHPSPTDPTIPRYDEYGDSYDVFGIGLEFLTAGHIFHLNFTNATNVLENRFIGHTLTSWGKGQYRWGFTIARNFIVFRDKKIK